MTVKYVQAEGVLMVQPFNLTSDGFKLCYQAFNFFKMYTG